MDPGTPISPSIPPRSYLAQVVTVRPRSAAQSTNTLLPSKRTSGSCRASCRTTHRSSPSGRSTLLPPPRKRYGTLFPFKNWMSPGRDSCLRINRTSEVPPISREVFCARDTSGLCSTPKAAIAASKLESLILMMQLHPRTQKYGQFARRAAHISSADGQDRVARLRHAQQFFNPLLHRAAVDDIFVSGCENSVRERLPADAWNRLLARRVDVHQHQHV